MNGVLRIVGSAGLHGLQSSPATDGSASVGLSEDDVCWLAISCNTHIHGSHRIRTVIPANAGTQPFHVQLQSNAPQIAPQKMSDHSRRLTAPQPKRALLMDFWILAFARMTSVGFAGMVLPSGIRNGNDSITGATPTALLYSVMPAKGDRRTGHHRGS